MSYQRKAVLGCACLVAINLGTYLSTLGSAVQFIDSGELAVVCRSLGIAHPTGYPLYTLLGRVFCLLPVGDTIFRVSLMSLVFACVTNATLFFVILTVVQSFSKRKGEDSDLRIWAALIASLIFSFTPTLWSQATSNEVYSLNVLLYALIILLLLIWLNARSRVAERALYLLVFVYALSFGNHMSAVLLLPALIFILIGVHGKTLLRRRRLIGLLTLFLLGLSIYLFLPIRSAQNPVIDWGNPETWSTFKRHVTGWQYQVWMFAGSAEELTRNLGNFIGLYFEQFPFYLLPLSVLGLWRLFVRDRKTLYFLVILFSANVLYGINYGIPDIDPYFLGSFLASAVFLAVGLHFIFELVNSWSIGKRASYLIVVAFILLPLVLLKKNYHQADRSRNFLAYDFASNLMRSVKKDPIILTNVWDHYSPWLYLRYVELKRPDVSYLDTELCRRTWYFDYVKHNYGNLYARSEGAVGRFLKEVEPFEKGRPFDAGVIERAYISMFNSFLTGNFGSRPLYDDLTGGPRIGKAYLRVPEGLAFSLKDSLKYYSYDFPELELRGVFDQAVFKDDRTLFNLKKYPSMVDLRMRYLSDFGREEEAQALSKRYKSLLSRLIR
jgi:hypothetical protein